MTQKGHGQQQSPQGKLPAGRCVGRSREKPQSISQLLVGKPVRQEEGGPGSSLADCRGAVPWMHWGTAQ